MEAWAATLAGLLEAQAADMSAAGMVNAVATVRAAEAGALGTAGAGRVREAAAQALKAGVEVDTDVGEALTVGDTPAVPE